VQGGDCAAAAAEAGLHVNSRVLVKMYKPAICRLNSMNLCHAIIIIIGVIVGIIIRNDDEKTKAAAGAGARDAGDESA